MYPLQFIILLEMSSGTIILLRILKKKKCSLRVCKINKSHDKHAFQSQYPFELELYHFNQLIN